MPRFTARNAVVLLNIILLTALFVHLKYELWDKQTPSTDLSHLSDELYGDGTTSPIQPHGDTGETQVNGGAKDRRTAVVVASQGSENATWLNEYFPSWETNIYRVDDPGAPLTVPKNKGRESMVYLTYIIDHYATLPDNVLFIHPNRYQWHNDDPDYDGLPMLRHLQLPYLEKEGYVNIRCAWSLGCPSEIKPLAEEGEHREAVHAGGDYKQAFQKLFPGTKVPETVGVSCCAQFAATREKIRERKKEEYIRYREWIMETELEDNISGRVLEYSWHRAAHDGLGIRPRLHVDLVQLPDASWGLPETFDADERAATMLIVFSAPSLTCCSALVFKPRLNRACMGACTLIFGKPPVHCPSAKQCYCKVFGLCGLTCEDAGSCNGRYTLPPYSSLPNGWPYVGWKGEQRQRTTPEQ